MLLVMLFVLVQDELQPPDMTAVMAQEDWNRFGDYLRSDQRVDVDLRPLLPDHGKLSASQTQLAFRRLLDRFELSEVSLVSQQGDTNYAWLELQIDTRLKAKNASGQRHARFLFQFKVKSGDIGMSRWILQHVR